MMTLTYGSEVWSIYDKHDYYSWENDMMETQTQIRFCKQILGMNKQFPNVVCRNELGRQLLKEITDVNNIIKFWIHLQNKQVDHYAKQCLQISKDMAEKNLFLIDNNSSTYIKNMQLSLREELTSHQYNPIRSSEKLKFYSIFKNDSHRSDCLYIITNINHKKKHWINSELTTIAYQLKQADIPYRKLQKITLFNCNLYDRLRSNFYRNISNRYLLFNDFDNNEKTLFIFNNVDPYIYRLTTAYIHSCMKYRQKLVL